MIFQAQISKDGTLSAEIPRFLWGKKITVLEADEVIDDLKEFGLSETDPWDMLDIETIAADTGRSDGSVHHDHYIYGTPKI